MKLISKYSRPLSALCACLSVYSVTYAAKITNDSYAVSGSVLALFLAFGFYLIIRRAAACARPRSLKFASFTGLLFSAMMIFGREIYLYQQIDYSLGGMIHKIFLCIFLDFLFASGIVLILEHLDSFVLWMRSCRLEKFWQSRPVTAKKYWGLLLALFFFVCWLPLFFGFYPGIFAYDVPNQIGQYYFRNFTTHHPLLHTLYMGFFVTMGHSAPIGDAAINCNAGAALYILTQMLFLALLFGCVCRYLAKWKTPALIQVLAILFFAFHPVNAMYSVSATKDVLFSGLFLLMTAMILDMFLAGEEFFASFKHSAAFIGVVILMCLFRNNGIYAFLVCLPFTLILFRKKGVKLFLLFLLAAILSVGALKALSLSLHAAEGSPGEMLSIPIQQLARTVSLHKDELLPQEYEEICLFLDQEKLDLYNPYLADPVKDGFNQEYFSQHTLSFFKLWIKLGLKYPGTYLDAFFVCSLGNWYPDMNYPNMHPYMEEQVKDLYLDITITRDSKLPAVEKLYSLLREVTPFRKYPVVSMLFSPGFAAWCMLFSLLLCLYKKERGLSLALIPCFGIWLTLLLSPIALMRYMYPIFICMPLFLTAVCRKKDCPR